MQAGQYAAYLERRTRFAEIMTGTDLDRWLFSAARDLKPPIQKEPGHKNWTFAPCPRRLGSVKLNLQEYQTADLIHQLEEILQKVSQEIDCALAKL